MKYAPVIIIIFILAGGLSYYLFSTNKNTAVQAPAATATLTPTNQVTTSPTPFPDTQSAIEYFLANKYNRPVSEVHVTLKKEVPGFASGSVLFGEGGPGEGGMWLAALGNDWEVVWDGNGVVDCSKMRQDYGFPDTILKPDFCN